MSFTKSTDLRGVRVRCAGVLLHGHRAEVRVHRPIWRVVLYVDEGQHLHLVVGIPLEIFIGT